MSKQTWLFILLLSLVLNPAQALFSKCNDNDYVRPRLEDFYLNYDPEEELNTKKILKKMCLKKPDDFLSSGASWYGSKFQGRYTANAEIYDKALFTAAHKTLPFGTFVLVTNPRNGREIIVKINDRGPFVKGRDLDLSEAAARELGTLSAGVATVNYHLLVNRLDDDD